MARDRHVFQGRGCLLYPDGTREWVHDGEWIDNILVDEGEKSIIDVYLRAQSNPSKYLFLIDDTVAETDTIATVTESETPGTDGYSRQQVAAGDWAAAALDATDYQSEAAPKTFGPNSGSAWSVQNIGVCTVATGTAGLLLAAMDTGALSVPTGIGLQWTTRWKLR